MKLSYGEALVRLAQRTAWQTSVEAEAVLAAIRDEHAIEDQADAEPESIEDENARLRAELAELRGGSPDELRLSDLGTPRDGIVSPTGETDHQ